MIFFYTKIIINIPFFANKDIKFILKLVENLKPIPYEKDEIIYYNKDYAEEGNNSSEKYLKLFQVFFI